MTVPAGGSVTVEIPEKANFREFEQVMFSTPNGRSAGFGSYTIRFGLGVLGIDDQGCVVFYTDGSFYQSNTECVAQCTASGVKAASGVIHGPTFTLTSTQGSSDMTVVWHAWGKPAAGWLPQMYRLWPEKRGRWR